MSEDNFEISLKKAKSNNLANLHAPFLPCSTPRHLPATSWSWQKHSQCSQTQLLSLCSLRRLSHHNDETPPTERSRKFSKSETPPIEYETPPPSNQRPANTAALSEASLELAEAHLVLISPLRRLSHCKDETTPTESSRKFLSQKLRLPSSRLHPPPLHTAAPQLKHPTCVIRNT